MSEIDNNSVKFEVDLTKPITTLIEKLADATGVYFEPKRIERKAKADAKAVIIKKRAEMKANDIETRANARLHAEEVIKQKNIESIIQKALPGVNKNANPADIDDDWLVNFFEKAKLTSDDQVQEIWARILSGEANKPQSYSRRTINLLAEMSKADAMQFTKLAAFSCNIGGWVPLVFSTDDDIYTENGVDFDSLTHLDSLGLIKFEPLGGYQKASKTKGGNLLLIYKNDLYNLQFSEGNDVAVRTGVALYTQQGLELLKVTSSDAIVGFEKYFREKIQSPNLTVIKLDPQ